MSLPSDTDAPEPPRRMTVGIVAEQRESPHPWGGTSWRPTGLIIGGGPDDAPRPLDRKAGVARWYVGRTTLELFPKETEGYRENLAGDRPQVFVVLRGDGRDGVVPFLATVCPYEAESYLESGEDVVEGVAMPPALAAWIRSFVARHHFEQPFVKRRQKPKQASVEPFRREPPLARPPREEGEGEGHGESHDR